MYTKYEVNGTTIIKFNADILTDKIKEKIDGLIVQICEGSNSFRLSAESRNTGIAKIKKELYKRIQSKSLDTQKGMISEFFIHLILNQENFKQDCLFFNMSERSIKKGFDGIYSLENELWIVDSKSGDCRTKNISHESKINEAYRSCKGLLDGTGTTNDIWAEAWNNVAHADVNANQTIKNIVQNYRLEAENGNHPTIDQMNIIPSSTIFTRKDSTYSFHSVYDFEGTETIHKQPKQKMILFHATNKMYIEFLRYLKEAV